MTLIKPLRLAAVGDISFEGFDASNSSLDCFRNIALQFRSADLVTGNLECPLTRDTGDAIQGKCRLRGSTEWAGVMKDAGVGLLSLANNHIMDYGTDGLLSTMDALRAARINFVGAGSNKSEACKPLFLDVAGLRLTFLARTAVEVSAPTYATNTAPGVAFLDLDETVDTIRFCRSRSDLVVIMVHWGIEEYSYPSPVQRDQARRIIDAGADLILGHHPHVLQGIEKIGNGMVAYSLGNFVFSEFEWSYALPDGTVIPQFSPLSPENRAGIVATFEWQEAKSPQLTTVFTRIGQKGRVSVDPDPSRERAWRILCSKLQSCCYDARWRWYAMCREWSLRFGGQLPLRKVLLNLHRIRLSHIRGAFGALRRSMRIVSEKTTNPYE